MARRCSVQDDTQAEALDDAGVKNLTAQRIDVETAYAQADRQVNAFEAVHAPATAGTAHGA